MAGDTKIIALPMLDLLREEDRKLVEVIKKTSNNREHGVVLDDLSDNRLYIAMVDLNGDGVQEFIVTVSSTFNCGNTGFCTTSIYQRGDRIPTFAGRTQVTEDEWIWVEDNWSNGWRILNNGKYRYCWVNESNPIAFPGNRDMFNMPYVDGQAGYFWSVKIGEECPAEHPHLD